MEKGHSVLPATHFALYLIMHPPLPPNKAVTPRADDKLAPYGSRRFGVLSCGGR